MEVRESGNSCLVPLVLFVLSPHMPGDPKTSIIDGSHLKNSVICRTDLTGTPEVSPFCSHFLGSAFTACFTHSLICISVLRISVILKVMLPPEESSFHCHSACQHLLFLTVPGAVPGTPHAFRWIFPKASKCGSLWHHHPQFTDEETKVQYREDTGSGHIANKWQNQNLNSAQADITDYNGEWQIWAKLLRYGPRRWGVKSRIKNRDVCETDIQLKSPFTFQLLWSSMHTHGQHFS